MDLTALQKEIEQALFKLTEQHRQLSNAPDDNPPEVMMEFISGLKMLYSKALVLQHERELDSLEAIENAIINRKQSAVPSPAKTQPVHIDSLLLKSTSAPSTEAKAPIQETVLPSEQNILNKPLPSHPSMDELLLAAANKAAMANLAADPTRKNKVITDIHDKFDEVPTLAGRFNDQETFAKRMAGSKTQNGVAELLQRKPIADLRASIGANEKFLFINHLFRGDSQMYLSSIDVLNSRNDMDAARIYIMENLIEKYGWDMGTHPARVFMDLVERRYIS